MAAKNRNSLLADCPKQAAVWLAFLALVAPAAAQDADADLAQQLSNPVASLISVPFQYNWNQGYGDQDGTQNLINIQPVIPFSISDDWNLISRTILPVVWQTDVVPDSSQAGIGDITQSLFFSPKEPWNGIIWGVGPVFYLPTGTDDLSAGKWGAGPTAVVLTQKNGWTVGALANHIWSFAGKDDSADISSTFLQPFLSYTTPDAWSFTVNSESTYNWETDEWSVPINFMVAKLVKIGKQPVQFQVGARYWAVSPDNGPEGWGARASVTFLFPTGR